MKQPRISIQALRLCLAGLFSACFILTACKQAPLSAAKSAQALPPALSAKIDEYARKALTEFYDYDLEALMTRADGRAADLISIEHLEALSDMSHETAQAKDSKLLGYNLEKTGNMDVATLAYNVPTKIGPENITISLSYDEQNCCKLTGFDFTAAKMPAQNAP